MTTDIRTMMWRYAIPVIVVAGCAATRFASPVHSAFITPTAAGKLTVYSGVVMIPNGMSALELGNDGRDIVATREIYFRPGRTFEGTKFTLENPVCSVDGKACGVTSDCDTVKYPTQICLNNLQDLTITGNLIVNGQLCYTGGGLQDCIAAWPNDASTVWAAVGTDNSLHPIQQADGTHDAIRIGDSWGRCSTTTTYRCLSTSDCASLTPSGQTCKTLNYSSISNMDTLSINSTTSEPALSVTRGASFGELEYQKQYYKDSGDTKVNGDVYIDGIALLANRYNSTVYKVWSGASPTDTQDGSGIDADTLDGDASLPFTVASGGMNDLKWWQYYRNPDGKTYPGVSLSEVGGGVMSMLCVNIINGNTATCLNGAKAGASCTTDNDCVANETCTGTVCSVTGGSCSTDADCPGKTTHPASGNVSKCQPLCNPVQWQCAVDNITYCSNNPGLVCSGDGDCPGGTCVEDPTKLYCKNIVGGVKQQCNLTSDCPATYQNACIPGKLVAMASCTNTSCQTYCRNLTKCAGASSGVCATTGQDIKYNTGFCASSAYCRCSLNVRNVTNLPYLDMKSTGATTGNGQACSLPFNVVNQPHPEPNP